MSRRLPITGCALLSALVICLGTGAATAAAQPGQDEVTANGPSGPCAGGIQIQAQSGPSGKDPSGQVTCGGFFSGPVTCLNVQGNVALLIAQTSQFGLVALRVVDNGGAGQDSVEAFPSPVIGCATPLSSYSNFGFLGDATVVDAQPPPPLPTSKDQCTNGGWRTFPGFKNQGDCVSFVATKGKNPPAQP
jgi:hypothetical protein